ncbi:MAG: extracellular solute-binding protein [Clostridiales bacterium]|nr:extracellular solute-binding protein [Clostridiales bacterium]
MKRTNLKSIAMILVLILCLSLLVSCGDTDKDSDGDITKQEDKVEKGKDASDNDTSDTDKDENGEWPEPNEMPIVDEQITLTMFTTFPEGHADMWEGPNEMPNMQALEEITNIKLDISAAPASEYGEKKNLLFASGDLPDIIYSTNAANDALKYGIEDDLIIALDELIEKYAYNFNLWVESEPDIKKQAIAADGKMYYMPGVDITGKNYPGQGFWIREEWVQDLDIDIPETLDELYNVLRLIKEKDPAGGGNTLPLAGYSPDYLTTPIFGAHGTNQGIYQVDGEIKFGPMEPEFKEALIYLNKLYSEELIASDYLTHDTDTYYANLIDNVAISSALRNAGMIKPLRAAGYDTEECRNVFRPMKPIKGTDGKHHWFSTDLGKVVKGNGEFISPSCEYQAEAMKWIDYKYSKEGSLTMTYGPRGKAWDFDDDGGRKLTDYTLNNPDGLTPEDAMLRAGQMNWEYTVGVKGPRYAFSTSRWPYLEEDVDHLTSHIGREPESLYTEYYENWLDFTGERQLPAHIIYTTEEEEEIDLLSQDINTFVSENMHKFIMGVEPMEKWDDIVQQLNNLKVDRLIEIYQGALDRIK